MYTTLGSPLCGSRSPDFLHRLRLNQRVEGISIDSTQYRKGSEFFVLSHFYPLVREKKSYLSGVYYYLSKSLLCTLHEPEKGLFHARRLLLYYDLEHE